jgi:hypothetical protein
LYFPRLSQVPSSLGSILHCCSGWMNSWHLLHMFLPFLMALPNCISQYLLQVAVKCFHFEYGLFLLVSYIKTKTLKFARFTLNNHSYR